MEMSHQMEVASEKEFISLMIPHHQEAVDSSQFILDKVQTPELKTFLESVISLQTQEIEQMKNWYKDWYGTDYQTDKNYHSMMSDFSKIPADQIEQTYIKEMIGHHLGAVQMANSVLNIVGIKPATIEFAQGVIDVQADEITLLQSWMK
jgi:uncharacterized protein (DUF305 family)